MGERTIVVPITGTIEKPVVDTSDKLLSHFKVPLTTSRTKMKVH